MDTFRTFWNSCLHGGNWPRGVHAFYFTNQYGVSPVFRNGKGEHAEDRVMASLREILWCYAYSSLSVTVFQSLSPCERCSQRYLELLEEARGMHVTLKLTIIYSGLYKIRRPSCLAIGCRHKLPWQREHDSQLEGMRQLLDCGVRLRCFQFTDWSRLSDYLQTPPISSEEYEESRRAEEDANMKDDMDELLGLTNNSLGVQAEVREDSRVPITERIQCLSAMMRSLQLARPCSDPLRFL